MEKTQSQANISKKNKLSNVDLIAQLAGISKAKAARLCARGLYMLRHNFDHIDTEFGLTLDEAERVKKMIIFANRMDVDVPAPEYITTARQVFKLIRPSFFGSLQEHFYMVMLDSANRVIKYEELSKGDVDHCCIPTTIMLRTALINGAVYVIMAHNHPNGDIEASEADIANTKFMYDAFQKVGIKMLDHIVMTDSQYASVNDYDDEDEEDDEK